MELTKREEALLEELEMWVENLANANPNDFVRTYDVWLENTFSSLPEHIQENVFQRMDNWLFLIQSTIQQSQHQSEKNERILTETRIIDAEIEDIKDLKRLPIEYLNAMANKEIANHRLIAGLQGGISGSGHPLLLGADIPAMMIINLRAVQTIASIYGYDTRKPFEMMIALKVFYCATLPKRFQRSEWDKLIEEVEQVDHAYFYEGEEQVVQIQWMTRPLSYILKALVILLLRKKKQDGVSLLGLTLGASTNYYVTKNVTAFAKRFYQYRFLREKMF